MSYHDFTPSSREGKIGKAIYLDALDEPNAKLHDLDEDRTLRTQNKQSRCGSLPRARPRCCARGSQV